MPTELQRCSICNFLLFSMPLLPFSSFFYFLFPLYYSIICRRLSHGRKLSLAGEQTGCTLPFAYRVRERDGERERESVKAWLFGFRSVRRTMPKVLAKLERVGSGHDSQINKQLLLVEHVATSSRSSLSLSVSVLSSLSLSNCSQLR